MKQKNTFKRLLLAGLLFGLAVPMVIAATCDLPENYLVASSNSPAQQKQPVCHKGRKTLLLPPKAAEAHLQHGDTPGACP